MTDSVVNLVQVCVRGESGGPVGLPLAIESWSVQGGDSAVSTVYVTVVGWIRLKWFSDCDYGDHGDL